jgi:starch-binding outer membrane protein, SusD/RagB family
LDERARELITEEFRLLTLMRLELLYERTKRYNWVSGPTIQPYNNLWPIPQTEIDRNFGAKLEQNQGYD